MSTPIVLVASLGSIALGGSFKASDQKAPTGDGQRNSPPAASNQTAPPVPPDHRSEQDAKPFPELLPSSRVRNNSTVARTHEIAHEIPGVLAHQPCYCGCDKHFGHARLLDCYASDHTAGCMVCLKESYFAFQKLRQGENPAAIREAIIRDDWRNTNLN